MKEVTILNYDYEIYKLTNEFVSHYPIDTFPEVLTKLDRPHYCLLIDTHCDYFICVPFRSNVRHNNAFHFRNTNRSKQMLSGLDYSKIAIIKNHAYLESKNVVVDNDEYLETIKNVDRITKEAVDYVNTYISHVNGTEPLHPKEFDRKYKYSTLKYYHDILGLNLEDTFSQNEH